MSSEAPSTASSRLVDELAISLEILANLSFLILEDAEDPEKVRMYVHMAEERLSVLRTMTTEIMVSRRERQKR
jgi:hypothetical protein